MTWTAIRQRAEEALSVSRGKSGRSRAALFRKELADHLNSRRFFLMFALLLLASTASLAGAVSTLREAESGEGLFLELFTTSSSYIYSFATFLAFLGPLAGIALGFDAINNERNRDP